MTSEDAFRHVVDSLVDGAEWTLDGETIRETAERINADGYGWTWDEYHSASHYTHHTGIVLSPAELEQAIAMAEFAART